MNKQEIDSIIEELDKHFHGSASPGAEQIRTLLSGNLQGPFQFVNLLRFKETAGYPSGHALARAGLSGADAYDKYGAVAFDHVTRRGGRLMTLNKIEQQLISSTTEWHRVATMEYKTVNAFIEMLLDPDYNKALVHRDAGLEATEIFVSRPLITRPVGRIKYAIGRLYQKLFRRK